MQKTVRESCLAILILALVAPSLRALDAAVTVGQVLTISVTADGDAPFAYQWYKDGDLLEGATAPSLVLANVQLANAGEYTAQVSNAGGLTFSDAAVVIVAAAAGTTTLTAAPVITKQPVATTAELGASVTFSVAATGSPTPKYQWRKNGASITGATAAAYSIAAVASSDTGTYSVVVTNSAGTVTSTGAALTLAVAPAITTQPVSKAVVSGTSVSFSVAATGTPAPSYQWRKNGVAISGATGASFALTTVVSADAGSYSVAVANAAGTVTSTNAVLTVYTAPVITSQPASQSAPLGGSVTFQVGAVGAPAPAYQWRKDGVTIAGANAPSYTVANLAFANEGSFDVVVSNSVGAVTSQPALLDVTVPVVPPSVGADFNEDGWTDLLWQDTSSGACSVWLMAGKTRLSTVVIGTAPAGWQIEGTGDFDGDGGTDILWRNRATGANQVWLMKGITRSSTVNLPSQPTSWMVGAVADLNDDGLADIVWRSTTTSANSVWLMNGTAVAQAVALAASAPNWQIQGAGDFNGDGLTDLLWFNVATLECQVRIMNGLQPGATISLGAQSAGWTLAGAGDLDDNGKSDVLWQSTSGQVRVWYCDGTAATTKANLTNVAAALTLRN